MVQHLYEKIDNNNIIIISAYRTCQSSIKNVGSSTNIIQQWQRLEKNLEKDTDNHDKMIIDLARFINDLQQQQHEIIVRTKFNKSNVQPKNEMGKLIHLKNLIDAISLKYGIIKSPILT